MPYTALYRLQAHGPCVALRVQDLRQAIIQSTIQSAPQLLPPFILLELVVERNVIDWSPDSEAASWLPDHLMLGGPQNLLCGETADLLERGRIHQHRASIMRPGPVSTR